MNWIWNLVLAIIIGAVIAVFLVITKNKFSERVNLYIYRGLTLALTVIFTCFIMSGKSVIEKVTDLYAADFLFFNTLGGEFLKSIVILLDWFTIAVAIAVCMAPWFKLKIQKHLFNYFILPIALLDLIFFRWLAFGFTPDGGAAFNIRMLFFAIEIGLVFGIALGQVLKTLEFKMNGKEVLTFFLVMLGMIIISIPSYAGKALFGLGPIVVWDDFSLFHRLLLYGGFVIPLILYFMFINKNEEVRRFAMIFISLALLTSYMREFLFMDMVNNPKRLPIHLCNTAMFLTPLCLIFKMNKLVYFTLFINVLGAFLAMLMPNYDNPTDGLFSVNKIHFFVNHYPAFFMPFLMVALRLFERPKLKHFMYSMIAFSVYFAAVLMINSWWNTDYFYVNSNFIAGKLGSWAEDLRKITWQFNIGELRLVFFPVYQSIFFAVYTALGSGMWFLYQLGYDTADKLGIVFTKLKIQREKKQEWLLEYKIDKTKLKEGVKEMEGKLVVRDFSKKYSSSKNFAVEKANLEVKSGEIFGFLGPNGAGKSTIIKSIVGIQPITSGSIYIHGYNVETQGIEAKLNTGYVPDHYALYEKLTGREYINYIADLYDVSKADRDERIQNMLDKLELNYAFDLKMETYSHGMKQKIAIIAALVHNPKLWILDEPLTGLDPNSIFQVKELMKEHAQKGNIVFFSSHIIDLVEKICTRIAIIKRGQIVAEKTIDEINKMGTGLEKYYMSFIGEKGAERGTEFTGNLMDMTSNNEIIKTEEKPKKKAAKKSADNVQPAADSDGKTEDIKETTAAVKTAKPKKPAASGEAAEPKVEIKPAKKPAAEKQAAAAKKSSK